MVASQVFAVYCESTSLHSLLATLTITTALVSRLVLHVHRSFDMMSRSFVTSRVVLCLIAGEWRLLHTYRMRASVN